VGRDPSRKPSARPGAPYFFKTILNLIVINGWKNLILA
jgi:hypothetical protein